MVQVWYLEDNIVHEKDANSMDSSLFLSLEDLNKRTGVEYRKFRAEDCGAEGGYDSFKRNRQYTYEDEVELSPGALPNFHELIKNFSTEHIHDDEEIRYVLSGSGHFDVRDLQDRWIRIKAEKDDLLIVPAGLYHRFTLDEKNYMIVKRLCAGNPCWIAHYRPQDDHPARIGYLERMAAKTGA